MGKSVIIIGAGIGGLAAGCYAQMNGYKTRIFEMGDKPGGLCTAWQRKGYTIDGCLHWLVGSAPGSDFYNIWQELGIVRGQQIYDPDRFFRFESRDGKVFDLFTDVKKLEQHMLQIAPEDAAQIKETVFAIRRFGKLNMPVEKAPELYSKLDGLKFMLRLMPVMQTFSKYSRMPVKEFAAKFKNTLLRESFLSIWPPEFSTMFLLMTLTWMDRKQAGYVIGGSMKVSRALEARYKDLGGEIIYKARADKILVEDNKAVGIRLEDGSEFRADYIVSAADGHATIFNMLQGKYLDDKIRGYYESLPVFNPLVYVGLGINRKFDDLPPIISGLVMEQETPVEIAGVEQKWLCARINNYDPTLSPEGKSVVTFMIETSYSYWDSLHKDTTKYQEEKQRIAERLVGALEKRFPGIKSQVEMIDIATPVTFERYTGNWKGSYEGWLLTGDNVTLTMDKTLPGLDNFYMAGQWVMPGGGLPSGAMTGRYVTQLMCKKDGIKFKSAKA
jgi:phytoene dehydrogenase-like protein